MKRLHLLGILTLCAIVAAPLILELIKADTGYILISLGSTTIETSFWFAVFAVVFGILVMRWSYILLRAILRSLGVSWAFFAEGRSRQLNARTQRGLIHYIEGNWQAAKKDLLSVAKYADQPLVHYLAAAHSAHQLGDMETCQALLSKAEEVAPENELAVLLSQAKMQLANQQCEQCLATLERARSVAPRHPVVLDLLLTVYQRVNDWAAVQALLPELKKSKAYTPEQLHSLEVDAVCAVLDTHKFNLDELKSYWQKLDKSLKQSQVLVLQYCGHLQRLGAEETAEQQLRRILTKQWDARLVELYGRVRGGSDNEQLLVAEQWLRERPGDPDLLLALARIAMRNQLWGKARSYFESSLQLQKNPQAYAEFAALLAQLGDHQKSTELYQLGLLQLTTHQQEKK